MSSRGLVHNNTFIFDGTNYDTWKIHMLNYFRVMDPSMERIVDAGFSPPKDTQNLSLEDEKNLYLNAQATHVIVNALSDVVTFSITPFRSAHEIWTKLQEKYGVSKIIGDDCIPSTSGRDELSSTSPKCGKTQGNDMVSGDETCNGDSMLTFDDPSSLSHCNASSLDLNTCSPINVLHACVDSPCISCVNFLNKSHDDMLALSCCHDTNASISSSICDANHIEETEESLGQDKVLNGASSISSSSSSHGSHICLMARSSNHNDVEDNSEDEENEEDYIEYLNKKGKVVFDALHNHKNVLPNFFEIMSCAIESTKLIEMKEEQIDKMFSLEREYANDIHDLKML